MTIGEDEFAKYLRGKVGEEQRMVADYGAHARSVHLAAVQRAFQVLAGYRAVIESAVDCVNEAKVRLHKRLYSDLRRVLESDPDRVCKSGEFYRQILEEGVEEAKEGVRKAKEAEQEKERERQRKEKEAEDQATASKLQSQVFLETISIRGELEKALSYEDRRFSQVSALYFTNPSLWKSLGFNSQQDLESFKLEVRDYLRRLYSRKLQGKLKDNPYRFMARL